MKASAFSISTSVCLLFFLADFSSGEVLTIWTFGPNSAGYTESPAYYISSTVPTWVMSGGDIDDNGKDGTSYTDAGGIFHEGGQGAAWDDVNKSGSDNDAALIVTLDTLGYSNLAVRWDYKSEEATSYDFSYRVASDAAWIKPTGFNNRSITADWDWHSEIIDLSSLADLDNQGFVQFLIDDLDEDSGNDRFVFDNIEITGVPEPTSVLLLGFGCLGVIRHRH